MATLNPNHLLEQADVLAAAPVTGRPRQADLRRAVSSAYYAVFHAIVNAAADAVAGASSRGTAMHALVARSIDHRTIRTTCTEILKPKSSAGYRPYLPAKGFRRQIPRLAAAFPNLQGLRHEADYDTTRSFTASDARSAIAVARSAYDISRTPTRKRAALSYS